MIFKVNTDCHRPVFLLMLDLVWQAVWSEMRACNCKISVARLTQLYEMDII